MPMLLSALVLLVAVGHASSLRASSRQLRFSAGATQLPLADALGSAVVLDPSYNLALGSLSLGLMGVSINKFVQAKSFPDPSMIVTSLFEKVGIILVVFGLFIGYQTTTLKFAFDTNSNFKLMKADGKSIGENIVVGGENSWASTSFVNYDFLPSKSFPILVYFKETQTPKENWIDAPIVVDDEVGQVHFFPAIANVDQLDKEFQAHSCKQINSAVKKEATIKSTLKFIL